MARSCGLAIQSSGICFSISFGGTNPVCATFPGPIPKGGAATVKCGGMRGRYVSVQVTTAHNQLGLCEIKVIGVGAKKRTTRELKVHNVS